MRAGIALAFLCITSTAYADDNDLVLGRLGTRVTDGSGNLTTVVGQNLELRALSSELGVVLAAFRTRRQMIQRLGRVLRRKPDGRAARLVVAFAVDTREDPGQGAQEDFLSEVTDVARSITTTRPT